MQGSRMTDDPTEYWGRRYEEYLDDLVTYDCIPDLTESERVANKSPCIDRQGSPASPASVLPTRLPSATAEVDHDVHYVIIREDLPRGFAGAQVVHASGISAGMLGRPVSEETYARFLAVRDEGHLLQISMKLDARGVDHVLVREPDAPWCGQATAIGIPPTRDCAAIRRCTSDLPRAWRDE